MSVTAFLSMWISNTATTAMMVPIAHAVLTELSNHRKKSKQANGNGNINKVHEAASNEQHGTCIICTLHTRTVFNVDAYAAAKDRHCSYGCFILFQPRKDSTRNTDRE
jgi:di/tricarboxylate transporter